MFVYGLLFSASLGIYHVKKRKADKIIEKSDFLQSRRCINKEKFSKQMWL